MNKETIKQLILDCGVEDLDNKGIVEEAMLDANYGIVNSREGFARHYKISLLALTILKQEIQQLKDRIDKTTNYYYKKLAEYEKENKLMPDESVMMFNLLEGNKHE